MENSTRVILHVRVTDLPGCPQDRHNFLGRLFCSQILAREFNNTIQPSNYDYIHIPPDFDTDKPVRKWFICDLNVNCPLSREEVLSLPHKVYYVSRQTDGWVFVLKEQYAKNAKSYCNMYCWGGRQEQELVAKLRQSTEAVNEIINADSELKR